MTVMTPRRTAAVTLVVAFCLVAANMRSAITAVGPVLDRIGADTGLSVAALGMITSVPLLVWAAASPFAHGLSRRFGLSHTLLGALGLLAAGVIIRSLPGSSVWLWLGTLLIGASLALGNVLMPAVVKRDFPGRVPLMMGVYSALLGAFGALASGVAMPLARLPLGDGEAGWRFALLVTGGALLPFAIVLWWRVIRRETADPAVASAAPRARRAIWADPVAWVVAVYMGLQASSFYIFVTWIPAISTSIGRSEELSGIDVAVYHLCSLAGSLSLPFLLRGRAERVIPAALPLLGLVGVAGLFAAPQGILAWIAAIGLFSGASLSMCLTLMAQRARDQDGATALSGMSQSVGYLITAVGPVAFGALHALSGDWIGPLVLSGAIMLGQALVGVFAGRDRYVFERR